MRLHKAYLEIPLCKVNFRPGGMGDAVTSLQQRLYETGYLTLPPTGIYDQATQEAVRAFQASQGLPPDGIVDWKTYLYIWRKADTGITPLQKTAALAAKNTSIHIRRSARTLSLHVGNSLYDSYPIAVGKPHTPTPLGDYAIVTKVMNPGGILGTRWMGLNIGSYGIHGTNRPWLIGQAVSLGCIRMHNENIEKLFNKVSIGTPVYIRE